MTTLRQQAEQVLDDLSHGASVGNVGAETLARRIRQVEEELVAFRNGIGHLVDARERATTDSFARDFHGRPFPAMVSTAELRAIINGTTTEVITEAAEQVVRNVLQDDLSRQVEQGKPLTDTDADWIAGLVFNALATANYVVVKADTEQV